MRIVFCIYDFSESQLPLQPWLTVRKVAEGLLSKGHDVHIITDIEQSASIDGASIHTASSLRGSNGVQIKGMLSKLRPEVIITLPTPLNIVTSSWLDAFLKCRRIGFASYPFYTIGELYRSAICLPWSDVKQYVRHALVPKPLWVSALKKRNDIVVTQSETTRSRLVNMGVKSERCCYIPPGINLDTWPQRDSYSTDGKITKLLYLGSAIAIRGFNLVLEALAKTNEPTIHLTVLARRAEGSELDRINALIDRYGLAERVVVHGGWADNSTLVSEIQEADAVVLPFVLIPSELPVTVMEAIACGTPVIGSRVDGMPSTIGAAGTVVRQGDSGELAEVLLNFHNNPELRKTWANGCIQQRARMIEWDSVVEQWEKVICDE